MATGFLYLCGLHVVCNALLMLQLGVDNRSTADNSE